MKNTVLFMPTRPGTSAFILKKALDAAQIVTIPLWTKRIFVPCS